MARGRTWSQSVGHEKLLIALVSVVPLFLPAGIRAENASLSVERRNLPSVAIALDASGPSRLALPSDCPAGELLSFTQEATIAPPAADKIGPTRVFRRSKGGTLERCRSFAVEAGGELTINPSRIWCEDNRALVHGGVLVVSTGKSGEACLNVQSAGRIVPNSDYGFALNLVDRRGDSSAYEVEEGFSGYWAFSRMRNRYFRPTINLSLLDFDKEGHDLEVGLGVGIVFKTSGLESDSGKGLSLGFGYGRNLMIRSDRNPGYWFLGIGFNVNTQKEQGQ